MKHPTTEEIAALKQLVSLRANLARGEIAVVQRRVESLKKALNDLESETPKFTPETAAAFERWTLWRDAKRKIMNDELALARAEQQKVLARSGREIAREEAMDLLARQASRREQKLKWERQTQEALLTSPAERYR